jgi:hypothetical protein
MTISKRIQAPAFCSPSAEKAAALFRERCSQAGDSAAYHVPVASFSSAELHRVLAENYVKLSCYMGDAPFSKLAQEYAASEGSGDRTLDMWVAGLPSYLRQHPRLSQHPELSEFAILELALNSACQSQGGPVFSLNDLARFEPENIAYACLKIRRPLIRLQFTTNVTSLWSSIRCGVVPPRPEKLDEPADVIVWRQGPAARFRILGKEEALVLEEAARGEPFGALCEMIAANGDPGSAATRAAGYLRGWIDAELICDMCCDLATADAK